MSRWKGSIHELLTEEQLKTIEESLADAPAGLCVDKRGLPLNRYPGMLSDLDRSSADGYKVVASERPVTEQGMILISTAPIPEIRNALLRIRTDDDHQQRISGRATGSRPGQREEDLQQKTEFHFCVFEPEATQPR
ncbi:hypothetical protein [Thioalkalivibrio paradoxus]|uniref:Uncharacterized protein n=1 Tax=Thioalkalivibrio paradoxus ARh 1 TaxID=713585 RepID=W0DTI4_9GAMM|nr:hypothetical protein [Thioalkalivibrio paradoxus]AHF00161.1 hypothetical protein THITH_10945 [Thioalkalivibrio paradoxus ARh 1]